MKIKSYIGIDNLLFTDNFKEISNKLKEFKIEKGETMFMDKVNLTLFVEQLDLLITFSNNVGDSVECFEINRKNVFFEDMNLMKLKYDFLEEFIKKSDPDIIIDEEGFNSPKFGFGAYRGVNNSKYTLYPKSVIVFNNTYLSKEMPSEDDIIKFYLGENYDPNSNPFE
ncbi:hypothetical protein C8C83_0670 [Flavobacterium sp. 90]|uniref:hypothetical protein n=1 Tax=unclassified Flavobacterium TaxID=196869 RepID=UPI000EB228B2|nr:MULTISPECIES: hypothetical protein [unclassified Flavobacterium]RKR09070.1 hypothetical protein C8C82_0968 [Flavobacterium sp. 81]TCK52854.1 hypothetical protein C8C83_0670 [Flavobacterium sp. 90]